MSPPPPLPPPRDRRPGTCDPSSEGARGRPAARKMPVRDGGSPLSFAGSGPGTPDLPECLQMRRGIAMGESRSTPRGAFAPAGRLDHLEAVRTLDAHETILRLESEWKLLRADEDALFNAFGRAVRSPAPDGRRRGRRRGAPRRSEHGDVAPSGRYQTQSNRRASRRVCVRRAILGG